MPPTTADERATDDLTVGLLGVIGPLRRLLRRRVQDDWPVEPLPAAQVDLVRLVDRHSGIGVAEAAARLRLAPNTVSTLVRQLIEADLVRRERDPDDGRSARLFLTPAAEARLSAWRNRRAAAARTALDALGADDRASLQAAIPALERLVEELAS
ncbi:MAG TPA: MarR family transcriptional regulator [Gaiellales bacterium]